MPGILCDTLLTLRSPVAHHDTELGVTFNTYLASCEVEGHHFAFSVAQPLPPTGLALQPHGGAADVHGSLTLHNKSLLFTATTVTGVYLPSDERTRRETRKLFQPILSFVGKVKRVHPPSLRSPAVKVIDVAVGCDGVWPYEDTVLTCYFNSRERRFWWVTPFDVGMSVSISGELVGWDKGHLAVEVQDASPNTMGDLPGRMLSVLPNLFQKLAISNSFAAFTDPNTLPPRAGIPGSLRGARTVSSQWLEIVAGLPSGGTSRQDSERSAAAAAQPVASTSSAGAVTAAGHVARRAISPRGTRARRGVAQPPARSPLSDIDVNVPVPEPIAI